MAHVNRSIRSRVHAQASARRGAGVWIAERVSSVALVPLSLWFLVSAIGLSGADHAQARDWLAGPFNTTAMILFVVVTFWHTQLGLRVIIEDYVHHEFTKFVSLMLVDFAAVALGLACVVAVLKVSLGS
jgi:succinate dehydrogenase / fumarate reductase membrane anchor subunit